MGELVGWLLAGLLILSVGMIGLHLLGVVFQVGWKAWQLYLRATRWLRDEEPIWKRREERIP